MPRCIVIGCNNNGNHSFPKDLQLKKLWERAIKIRNFTASKNSRLCSNHFKEADYQGISDATGLPQQHRYLKKTAVPSVFVWNKAATPPSAAARAQRYTQRSSKKELYQSTSQELSFNDATQDTPEKADQRVYVFCSEHLPEVPDHQHEMEVTSANLSAPPTLKTTATQTPPMFRLFSSGDDMLSDARSVICQARLENFKKFNLYLIEEFK